jgi:ABC-type maltose transport system permease subunit
MSTLSIFEPISVAAQRSKRLLFEPFQLRKWLRLGFCAFLMGSLPMAGLPSGDSSFNTDADQGHGRADSLSPWFEEHLTTLLILAAITAFLVLLLVLLCTWLSSRARFMLLVCCPRNTQA